MNSVMNETQLTNFKEFEFKKPLIDIIDSIFDNCIKDCQNKYFHTTEYLCACDGKLTNNGNNEIVHLTIADESMGSYELNKNWKIARQNGFILNRKNILTTKNCSHLSIINICYYLKFPIPICHRHFFRVISQNIEHVRTHCNYINIPF